MKLIDRFTERKALIESLFNQYVVHGDLALANAFADILKLRELPANTQFIDQGGADNSFFMILAGEVSAFVNGCEIARRRAGQHVGEMALIDNSATRSATVIARDTVVVAEVSESDFTTISLKFPNVWRRIAGELGNRLRQRSRFVRERNNTPIIFIGSSRESLPVVTAIADRLKTEPIIIRPWTRDVFSPSQFPIDDLAKQVMACDFAALVFGPDDELISRGATTNAPRDNVILELGLFMGALERSRTFLIVPRDVDIKIPSDILGLTPLRFDYKTALLSDNLTPVCSELMKAIKQLGAR